MNGPDPLAQLRDIHLPAPVSWWPPAPGWWLLAAVILVALVAGVWWWRRRTRLRRAALAELDRLVRARPAPAALAVEVSALLRRVALVRHGRTAVAGLHGRAWVDFLARHGRPADFGQGVGKALALAPYAPHVEVDGGRLVAAARNWIRRNT